MPDLTIFLTSLDGGGAERAMVNLARGFVDQGVTVDMVLVKKEGPYLPLVPKTVRLIDLGEKRLLLSLPALIRYLIREQPTALLSSLEDTNIIAIWARWLSKQPIRLVVNVQNTLSQESQNSRQIKKRLAPMFAKTFYPWADKVVPVSHGVADDLTRLGLRQDIIEVIHNPVVTPELFDKATEPIDHPWFAFGQPPVLLGVGRLDKQKDFPTLIRAFALVQQQIPARLMILGEGSDRASLEDLVRELNLSDSVAMPGFVDNPFAYMARSATFVLSSLFEGLPTVLIESLAVGTPVVSTDCKSGPAEILVNGKYGKLVPVGNVIALAEAIVSTLKDSPNKEVLRERASTFSLEKSVEKYRKLLQI